MKKALTLFATILLFSFTTFAQSTASATADVKASIAKGLTITNIGGSLDYGEIIANTSGQTVTIDPDAGAEFEVTGHPGKSVDVTFSDVTLTGTGADMTFTPYVQETQGSPTYSGANDVTSGNSVGLFTNAGTGYLYLWVGGDLAVGADQVDGSYSGTFTITVAY